MDERQLKETGGATSARRQRKRPAARLAKSVESGVKIGTANRRRNGGSKERLLACASLASAASKAVGGGNEGREAGRRYRVAT